MLAITTETFLYAKAVNSCKDETLTCLPNDYTMQMFKILAAEEHTTVKKQTNKKKSNVHGEIQAFFARSLSHACKPHSCAGWTVPN